MKAVERHLWWAVGSFLLILSAVLVMYVAVPKRYTASARIWLGGTNAIAAGQPDRFFRPGEANSLGRELRLLTSPDMVARVIIGSASAARGTASKQPSGPGLRGDVAALIDNITATPVAGSSAAVVSYSDADPVIAAEVTNRLAANYVAYRRETGVRAHRLRQLRLSTGAARDEMNRAQVAATTYRATANPTDDADLQRLRGAADAADRHLAELRSGEAGMGDNKAGPGERTSLTGLYAQMVKLTADRAQLQKRYGPLHPDIIAMNARVAALIDAITAETRRVDGAAGAARKAHEELDARSAAIAQRQEHQALLDSTIAATTARYVQSVLDLGRVERLPPNPDDAHVMVPARPPSTPTFPNPWIVAASGLVVALLGAGAVVGVRELNEPGFSTSQSAERKLRIPVIGMVPEMAHAAGPATSRTSLADLILSDTSSPFASSFRSINAGLGIGGGVKGPRTIVVSSAVEAEGKTMVAIGIARSAALAGLRVLLIDCDVRRPAVSQVLAADAQASLADVLAGKTELTRALVRDDLSGAWILASKLGGPAANSAVGSDAMADLIKQAVHDYDLVLIDTAPVLALVETRIVAAFADRVLLVARWRTTPVGATRTALNILNEMGATVFALALTRVS